jgi:hypothetical protein
MTLTSTQHRLLSRAAQRDDHALELPGNLKGGAAAKVAAKLLADGLVEEIGSGDLPVWRHGEDKERVYRIVDAKTRKAANPRRSRKAA